MPSDTYCEVSVVLRDIVLSLSWNDFAVIEFIRFQLLAGT
jgi:hypothetical protein